MIKIQKKIKIFLNSNQQKKIHPNNIYLNIYFHVLESECLMLSYIFLDHKKYYSNYVCLISVTRDF